jgi:hypothetical protein
MGFPKPVDTRLTAPLELPVVPGSPLTTQGGSTLDDGYGDILINQQLGAPGSSNPLQVDILGAQWFRVDGSSGSGVFKGSVQINNASTCSSGTGAPTIAGTAGDFFFRTDTPSTANQRIYVCTVTGAAGAATWVGIV